MTELKIILPWPGSRLSPNRKNGRHWGSFQAAKEKARRVGVNKTILAIQASGVIIDSEAKKIKMQIVFFEPDRRRRDLDNLLAGVKNYIDGVAVALGVDDSVFCPITLDRKIDPAKNGYVELSIFQDAKIDDDLKRS